MSLSSSSPLSGLSHSPPPPTSPSSTNLPATIPVAAPVAVDDPPPRRSGRATRPTAKASASSTIPTKSLPKSETAAAAAPKRGRGRPKKVQPEPAAPTTLSSPKEAPPPKRGRGRPPKRKAETPAEATPAAKKTKTKAPATRPKRALKPRAKLPAKAPPAPHSAPAAEPAGERVSTRNQAMNKVRGYSGEGEAPTPERVGSIEHALARYKTKELIPEAVWRRDFGAVLPEPASPGVAPSRGELLGAADLAAGRAAGNGDDGDGDEEEARAMAAFYAQEVRNTHHPDRVVYKPADWKGAATDWEDPTPVDEARRRRRKGKKELARDWYGWDSREEHEQAPESSCR